MAEGIIQELARQYLARGQDIAKDMRGMGAQGNTSEYVSTPAQQMRYSMDNVRASGDRGIKLTHTDGSPVSGVSEANMDRYLSEYEDQYFNNLPMLLNRDADGNLVFSTEDASRGATTVLELSDMLEGPDDSGTKYTRLQLLAGEMLALSRKAMDAEASPEELELLNTYQEFMQSRTGS